MVDRRSALPSIERPMYSEENEYFEEGISHEINPDAHHAQNHAQRHSIGGVDEISPASIGAGRIRRFSFVNQKNVTIQHNLRVYPMVQIHELTGELVFGSGYYGSGSYGRSTARTLTNTAKVTLVDENSITLEFNESTTGEVILIG